MKCCFFMGRFMMTCKANADVYVPSSFEIEEYCGNIRHKVCPLYSRARNLERRRIYSAGSGSIYLSGQ